MNLQRAPLACGCRVDLLPSTMTACQVDAEKRVLIKHLPHTLVLHLKRFEWDYETYQRWKVRLHCPTFSA